MQIWKFVLSLQDTVILQVPRGTKFLSVGEQSGELVIWGEVHSVNPLVPRILYIRGTGHSAPNKRAATFVGTVQMPPFVWHIYDGGESNNVSA